MRSYESLQAELAFNLGQAKGLLELLINMTPTGPERNALTEMNIHHFQTIDSFKEFEYEQRKARGHRPGSEGVPSV